MVANILMDSNAIHITMKALVDKMCSLNSVRAISGVLTDGMQEDYELCKQAYDALAKGLESISVAETMAKEKK
jgi:hypothetical protein